MPFWSPGLRVTSSLQRERSSYNRQQKKGRDTLTLLNFILVYCGRGNCLVEVVSIASVVSFYLMSVIIISCTSTVIIVFMGYMHILGLSVGLRNFMFALHYSWWPEDRHHGHKLCWWPSTNTHSPRLKFLYVETKLLDIAHFVVTHCIVLSVSPSWAISFTVWPSDSNTSQLSLKIQVWC